MGASAGGGVAHAGGSHVAAPEGPGRSRARLLNPRTVLQGLTPPKVHERAGDRDLSRVSMTLVLEG